MCISISCRTLRVVVSQDEVFNTNTSFGNSPSSLKKFVSSPNMCSFSLRLTGLTEKSCRTCSPSKLPELPAQSTPRLCESVVAEKHQDKAAELIPFPPSAQFPSNPASKQLRAGTAHTHRVSLEPRSGLSFRQYQHLKTYQEKAFRRETPKAPVGTGSL